MTPKSISIRHEIYFKLLATLDLLWTDNFEHEQALNQQTLDTIERLTRLTEQLVLLAQRHLLERQSD